MACLSSGTKQFTERVQSLTEHISMKLEPNVIICIQEIEFENGHLVRNWYVRDHDDIVLC